MAQRICSQVKTINKKKYDRWHYVNVMLTVDVLLGRVRAIKEGSIRARVRLSVDLLDLTGCCYLLLTGKQCSIKSVLYRCYIFTLKWGSTLFRLWFYRLSVKVSSYLKYLLCFHLLFRHKKRCGSLVWTGNKPPLLLHYNKLIQLLKMFSFSINNYRWILI